MRSVVNIIRFGGFGCCKMKMLQLTNERVGNDNRCDLKIVIKGSERMKIEKNRWLV